MRQDDPKKIVAKNKVYPNQVSTWKRQVIDGLGDLFLSGTDRAHQDRETGAVDLHAMVSELMVERDFLARGLKR